MGACGRARTWMGVCAGRNHERSDARPLAPRSLLRTLVVAYFTGTTSPALSRKTTTVPMSLVGSIQSKIGDYMGWSSGAMMTPAGQDRLGVIPEELTPEFISRAVRQADQGHIGLLQESYMKMISSDPHLRGEVNKLGMALSDYPLRVSPAASRTPKAVEAAEMMETVLSNPALKTREIVRSMAKVHFSGIRIYQNEYRIQDEGGLTLLEDMDLIPPTRYKMERREGEPDYGKLRVLDEDSPEGTPIASYGEGALTKVSDEDREGFWDLAGVGRTCLFWFAAKHFNSKWWSEFNETYGEPIRVGYYDNWADDQEREEMRNFLQQLGRAAWAILPSTNEFEFLMPDMGQVKTYEDMVQVADQQMSKAVVGQIGTSGRSENGSYGEGVMLNSIRYEIVKAISGIVEESLHPTVHFMCKTNIDPDFPIMDVPRVYLVVPNPEEKSKKADLFQSALEMGMEVPEQHAHDELGIPKPSGDEETLSPDDLAKGADGAPMESNPKEEANPSEDSETESEPSTDGETQNE